MNAHGTLRKALAFFKRDLAIARSYRMTFVLKILEAFLALPPFITSHDLFPTISLPTPFRRGAITSPSRWWALRSSTISPSP